MELEHYQFDLSYCYTCGDLIDDPENACDDGGNVNGNGCSSTCTIEPGYECNTALNPDSCTTICGDGKKVGNESCDDGNTTQTTYFDGCVNCAKSPLWNCVGGSLT
jgi:large repetitive protein